jgi:hypothetical protein
MEVKRLCADWYRAPGLLANSGTRFDRAGEAAFTLGKNTFMTRDPSWSVRLARNAAVIVLILPGGSLIALSLWMLRHRTWLAPRSRRALAALLAFGVGLIFPR